MKTNLSKSKYCDAFQCKKKLWLESYKPEVGEVVANSSALENGIKIGELARNLFGEHININYSEDLEDMINQTKKILNIEENVTITEASFCYDNNFCSVDILKKIGNNYEIYEVKSSTKVSPIYLEDITYQTYILSNLGYNIVATYIVYVNRNYERNENFELDKYFTIKNVTGIVSSKILDVENNINEMKKYLENKEEPGDCIDVNCQEYYECPFFKYCTKHLPEKNIFSLRGMSFKKKIELYKQNIYSYEDLLNTNLNKKYKQQIEFELFNKEPIIEKDQIKDFMAKLYYPLYFLDFESYQPAIPEYSNLKPFTQVPFQYSLHYINEENGNLEHTEFLAEALEDPRRKLAEQLVNDIPVNACVLAYNMMFERMIIRDLARLFPDLKEALMKIHNNIQDLMIPFKKRWYYVKEMYGSFSIKYVLPALFPNDPSLNYHNLEQVHNGVEASSTFNNLANMSKTEQKKVRKNLLKYCGLDTYAMVKIWEKLNEVIKGS